MAHKSEEYRLFQRWVKHPFEALLAYLFFYSLKLLPVTWSSAFGGFLGRKLGIRLGVTKKARKNLQYIFPKLNDRDIEEILLGMWDHLGRMIAEYPHLDKIFNNYTQIDQQSLDLIKQAVKSSISPQFLSGHIGNWELNAYTASQSNLRLTMIYRKPNNALVDTLLQKFRGHGQVANFYPKGSSGAKELIKALQKNKPIGMLMDQKFNEGIEIPFLGKSAMTSQAPGDFFFKYRTPIYLARVIRTKGCHFRVEVVSLFDGTEFQGLSRQDCMKKVTTRVSDQLGQWILEYPQQWLWIHNRWKR